MGKVTGFKEFSREVEPYRPAKSRVLDFKEIYTDHDDKLLNTQAARCMNCGVPFCQSGEGCPVIFQKLQEGSAQQSAKGLVF